MDRLTLYAHIRSLEMIGDDDPFVKKAQVSIQSALISIFHNASAAFSSSKDFVNFITPAVIYGILNYFGFKWWGIAAGILTSTFKIDVASLLSKVVFGIQSLATSKKQDVTTTDVSSTITDIVQSFAPTDIDPGLSLEANKSYKQIIREAKLFKIAGSRSSIWTRSSSIIIRGLTLIFSTLLLAFGFMAAGDVIRSVIGLSSTQSQPDNTSQTSLPSPSVTYPIERKFSWQENFTNNTNGIELMIKSFTNEEYPETSNIPIEEFRKSKTFNEVVDIIEEYNASHPESNFVSIPKAFKSKKQIVDNFIKFITKPKA